MIPGTEAADASEKGTALEGRVRLATEQDLPALEWGGLFRHHREIIERTFREQVRGEQLMLVADIGGEPAGQVWIDFRLADSDDLAVVWALRVHPHWQGCGVGAHLVRAAERMIGRRGISSAELTVEIANRPARRLYERLGYQAVDQVQESYAYTTPDGVQVEHELDLLRMRRELWRGKG